MLYPQVIQIPYEEMIYSLIIEVQILNRNKPVVNDEKIKIKRKFYINIVVN